MKRILIPTCILIGCLLFPYGSSAKQQQVYMIGDEEYLFDVGVSTWPTFVNTKTGIRMNISKVKLSEDPEMNNKEPVTNLSERLQAEVALNGETIGLPLNGGNNGVYTVEFVPTQVGQYVYRLFGAINGETVDISFECEKEATAPTDPTPAEVGSGSVVPNELKFLLQEGTFACPTMPEDLTFPKQGNDDALLQRVQQLETSMPSARQVGGGVGPLGPMQQTINMVIGLIGVFLSTVSLWLWWREIHI